MYCLTVPKARSLRSRCRRAISLWRQREMPLSFQAFLLASGRFLASGFIAPIFTCHSSCAFQCPSFPLWQELGHHVDKTDSEWDACTCEWGGTTQASVKWLCPIQAWPVSTLAGSSCGSWALCRACPVPLLTCANTFAPACNSFSCILDRASGPKKTWFLLGK